MLAREIGGAMKPQFIREGHLDRESAVSELRRFLDLAIREMHLDVQYDLQHGAPAAAGAAVSDSEAPEIVVNFRGPERDLLLERHGELLLALEYIAIRWLRLEPRFHSHIRFDCGDFRELRIEELKLSARVAAQRVRETRQPFHFNPMPARERRLIHLELSGAPNVRTESEGIGDHRHLVVYPAEAKK